MKTISLVNTANVIDVRNDPRHAAMLRILDANEYKAVEYYSETSDAATRARVFEKAVHSDSDAVWAVMGGTQTLDILQFVDWNAVKRTGKPIIGTSDLTHVAWMCARIGVPFVYAFDLINIANYFPASSEQTQLFARVNEAVEAPRASTARLLRREARIVGGHSFTSMFMLQTFEFDLSGWTLFLEHHHDNETVDDALYWFRQFAYIFRDGNVPDSVILGHHEVSGNTSEQFAVEVEALLSAAGVPLIDHVDHYREAIPIG